jgi:uncharacterized membrane-anchored protein
MQTRHVPRITTRYWTGIIFASIFGTNLGDLYAHHSGMGLVFGLLPLAVLFTACLLTENADRTARMLYYWLAIIIIRTGATNIGDELAYRVRIPGLALTAGLAALMAVLAWRAAAAKNPANSAATSPALTKTNLAYWGAMLAAGVFGTVAGDICSHVIGQGAASIVLGAAFLAVLLAAGLRAASSVPVYWCAVAFARTAGTCMGDFLAENRIVHIGLPLSTLLTGAAFLAVLTFWRLPAAAT